MTLFHWDTPQAIEDAGGWPVRDTVDAFAEYVEAVAGRLGDRVGHWITHNEPWVVSWVGHGWGHHAPGRDVGRRRARDGAPSAALARPRGRDPAARVAEVRGRDHAQPRQSVRRRATSDADAAAARWVDGLHNRWFLDPIFNGAYPEDMVEAWADDPAGDARRRSRDDRGADRLPRRQQLHVAARRGRRERRPLADRAPQATSTAPTWAGRSCPKGCTTCSSASSATTRRRRST